MTPSESNSPERLFKNQTFQAVCTGLLFSILIILGLINFKDYGLAHDEVLQRKIGLAAYMGLFEPDKTLPDNFKDHDYGIAFELPLIVLEKWLNTEQNSQKTFYLRHLCTHLFFLSAVWCFYCLIKNLYSQRWLAWISTLILAGHPLIYGHSFFNSKDIPALCLLIFCLWAFERSLRSNKLGWVWIGGLLTGIFINIRIFGLLFLALSLPFLVLSAPQDFKEGGKRSALWLLGSLISLYASWPYLWPAPVTRLLTAISSMIHFRERLNCLLWGDFYLSDNLPWFYFPSWFMLTTPIVWLFLGILGILFVLAKSKQEKSQSKHQYQIEIFSILMFTTPICLIFILKPVLYDGWRHFYFIYPCFILLAITGLKAATEKLSAHSLRLSSLPAAITVLSILSITIFMFTNHPHQYVYFNSLLPQNNQYLRRNFDRDYWAVSYRQGFEHILSQDNSPTIRIALETPLGSFSPLILSSEEQARIEFSPNLETADYFISNYRWHPQSYQDLGPALFEVSVQQNTVVSIWKLKKSP